MQLASIHLTSNLHGTNLFLITYFSVEGNSCCEKSTVTGKEEKNPRKESLSLLLNIKEIHSVYANGLLQF